MTTYYVNSGASGTNAGTSWTDAYTAFGSAVTAATTAGDVILVHYTHQENLAGDTTYTFGANISIISVNKDSSDAPTAMGTGGWIGSSTASRGITIAGIRTLYFYGITLRNASTSIRSFLLADADGAHCSYESCYFWLGVTNASYIAMGTTTADKQGYVYCKNCTFRFGAAGSLIAISSKVEIVGGSLSADGTSPTVLFNGVTTDPGGFSLSIDGFDASALGSNTLVGASATATGNVFIANSKLGTSMVPLATQTLANGSGLTVSIYNCAAGDEHYHFGYYNAFGSLVCVPGTGVYCNDGALYDGTNHVTWKIDTSANCSLHSPFITPWIEKYHSGTSQIAPYLEILRDGSSTAFDDDEVWAECGVQNNTGVTLSSFVDDRVSVLGTPAAQTNGVGVSGWTNDNATAWSGKLVMPNVTPAEIGMLRMRVCVGVNTSTTPLYVDPKIRT